MGMEYIIDGMGENCGYKFKAGYYHNTLGNDSDQYSAMMKFAIFREIVVDGKKKKKFLVEWDEETIKKKISQRIEKNAGIKADTAFQYAWEDTIREFKKETIRIP